MSAFDVARGADGRVCRAFGRRGFVHLLRMAEIALEPQALSLVSCSRSCPSSRETVRRALHRLGFCWRRVRPVPPEKGSKEYEERNLAVDNDPADGSRST